MWFDDLTGFEEVNAKDVRKNIKLEGEFLLSMVNGRKMKCGTLEVPMLNQLRNRIDIKQFSDRISISIVHGDVQQLHIDPRNENAVFQAASQFNLLEMVDPNVTPDHGIADYQFDKTQGPACAIACGAGTIYRNYFAEVNGETGQTANNQIDCMDEIGAYFENKSLGLWKMKNGYLQINRSGLDSISTKLDALEDAKQNHVLGKLKIGVQWDTEVTLEFSNHTVTQVYCSGLPIGYSNTDSIYWEKFARLVLDATYEATFYIALENYIKTGNSNLYLTLVGGGVFANDLAWIFDAIDRSVQLFSNTPLNVCIVSYSPPSEQLIDFVGRLRK